MGPQFRSRTGNGETIVMNLLLTLDERIQKRVN